MSKLISIHVGGAGLAIGRRFWERVLTEHGLDHQGSAGANAVPPAGFMFRQATGARWVPRAILVDLDPNSINAVKAAPVGNVFRPDNFLFTGSGAGNNWAKGHYTEGAELIDSVMDVVRREVEAGPLGTVTFLMTHSLSGGTGGGLGTLIANRLRSQYPDAVIVCASVLRDKRTTNIAIAPYNEVLSLASLTANADLVVILDNAALYDAAQLRFGSAPASFVVYNAFIAAALARLTSPLRLRSGRTVTPREIARTLTPLPFLKLVGLAMEGWPSLTGEAAAAPEPGALLKVLGSARNRISGIRAGEGRAISAVAIAPASHPLTPSRLRAGDLLTLPTWHPPGLRVVRSSSADPGAALVENHTGVRRRLGEISADFAAMFKRRSFLHLYTGEGMDEMELQEADKAVRDLIAAYQAAE